MCRCHHRYMYGTVAVEFEDYGGNVGMAYESCPVSIGGYNVSPAEVGNTDAHRL